MKFRIFSPLRLLAQTVHGMGKRVLIVALGMAVSAPCLRAQNAAEANTDKQTIQMLLQRIERLESRVAQLEGTHAGEARTETATTVHPPAGPAADKGEETLAVDLLNSLLLEFPVSPQISGHDFRDEDLSRAGGARVATHGGHAHRWD